jgi:small-conductance mechanosensitive channel
VAKANARVLAKPAPIALLQEFSDSAMIFTLRVYHTKIADRLRGLHEINTAITHAFQAAGIRFAFPQRDLHLHGTGPAMDWFGPQEEEGTPASENQDELS